MKHYLFSIAAFATAALSTYATDPIQHPDCGTIDRAYLFSPQMGDTITVDTWLPDGYSSDTAVSYPVIYMHDGQNLYDAKTTWNHQAWEIDSTMCRLASEGAITPAIVVGIHSVSKTRVADLMPEDAIKGSALHNTLRSVGVDVDNVNIRGNEYCDFIVETLKPYIDKTYRTLPDMRNTSVMGSSMGGLMSIYALCRYPEVFGNAMCLSTHWIGTPEYAEEFTTAMHNYIKEKLPPATTDATMHKLYFDHGTATLDAYYGPSEERILLMIREKGYDERTLLNIVAKGAAHDELSWAKRLSIPLVFILGK